jgi:hypothetical protein
MVIAMMMVTTAPMITASQAVTRITASRTSNNASGSSATRVLPRIEFRDRVLGEVRCGKKHGRRPSAALPYAIPALPLWNKNDRYRCPGGIQ